MSGIFTDKLAPPPKVVEQPSQGRKVAANGLHGKALYVFALYLFNTLLEVQITHFFFE